MANTNSSDNNFNVEGNTTTPDYARQVTPLSCEREPIHIVNRIQPCGTLLVIDADLIIVQCSTNAVSMLLLPRDCNAKEKKGEIDNDEDENHGRKEDAENAKDLLDTIIGSHLSLLLQNDAVEKVRAVVRGATSSVSKSQAFKSNRNQSGSSSGGGGANSNSNNPSDTSPSSSSTILRSPPPIPSNTNNGAVRNFLVRTQGSSSLASASSERRESCCVTQSGEHFLLEIEDPDNDDDDRRGDRGQQQQSQPLRNQGEPQDNKEQSKEKDSSSPPPPPPSSKTATGIGEEDTMIFMQSIAHELRKCWSIEEMAGLVCSRIMSETPYDRGMVYRFDPSDHSGEVVYETTRWDARKCCREDSFLGLRFPASDIPRQARELFMRNTLRFVYDVEGVDYALYPAKIVRGKMMGVVHGGEARYTDLSMCRLRGSSYIHLEYLRNMKVTSTLVIAIIVNKRLWGLYSFHGYRHPIRPSARTRFLCEMASVMTSMVMESLTRTNDQSRLMNIDDTLSNLKDLSLIDYMNDPLHSQRLFDLLDVNLISFRSMDDRGNVHIYNYHSEENNIHQSNNNNDATTTTSPTTPLEVTPEAFQCLSDTYGQVCHDYGVVFVNETKAHPALGSLHTIAFFQFPPSHPNPNNNNNNNNGSNNSPNPSPTTLDVLLSRKAVVELVEWGGDPEKTLQSDGTLSPRSSFTSFVKGHLKKGKPWDEADKARVKRFVERLEKYRSNELFERQNVTIETLGQERNDLIKDQKDNLDFFAFMAHELRTPFHGVLGSLEAMREDPTLANNQLLNNAYMCGKNMIRILDDILLVAKGSYSLNIQEEVVDVSEFLRQTVGDMRNFAYMEGVSVRVRKEDVHIAPRLSSDFNRIRQVVHNLISNAIKFSEDDIHVELLQRRTFSEVLTVWKTYAASYPHHEPRLKDIAPTTTTTNAIANNGVDGNDNNLWIILSVIDKGIGIKDTDLNKLGTAFTQLSQGRQKKFQGTGLGITISNMIISALKGQLVVFSAPDYGSCFTFAIPVQRRDEDSTPQHKNSNSKEDTKLRMEQLRAEFEQFGFANSSDTHTGKRRSSSPPRVLVVDDSTINRKICSQKIKKLLPAVEITECASGKSCIEEYEHGYKNIMGIFLDFHMPGMDGDVVARKIREFEKVQEDVEQEVWIVGYTADILDETRNVLLEAGMNHVMPKPEPMHAFEAELRTMIRRAAKEK